MSGQVATADGKIFGLVLETINRNGIVMPPGTVLIKTETSVNPFFPASRDPIYFAALVLWLFYAGPSSYKFSTDTRLPDFVRKAIADFKSQLTPD